MGELCDVGSGIGRAIGRDRHGGMDIIERRVACGSRFELLMCEGKFGMKTEMMNVELWWMDWMRGAFG